MKKKKAAQGDRFQTRGNYTMPAPDSQCAEILARLQQGESLTTYQMHMIGMQGATARIKDLRDNGYPIVCVMEKHVNKHGKTVRRGRYFLATKQEGKA